MTLDLDPHGALSLGLVIRLDRLTKRKCQSCERRRILFALRGYGEGVILASSRRLCGRCAGLVP